jgi:hypothetical protein
VPARAVASRVMGETALLLHPRADEVKLCNETGTLVWRLVCEGGHDVDAIAVEVARVFEVELGTARTDVDAFLAELEREGFLDWQELPKAP